MSVDLPTPAQATIVTTLTSLFAHARCRKATSSSRPNKSLPVTGSLAIEILFGASLAGDLRVPTREAVGGAFREALTSDSTPCVDSAYYRRHRLQQFGSESGNVVPDPSEGVSRGELRPAVEHL